MNAEAGVPVGDTTLPQEETDVEFLARIRAIAEDWRFSYEFVGLVVRQRYPQKYNEDRAYPQRDWR